MNFEDKRFSEINKIEIILGIVNDDDSHLISILYDDAIEEFLTMTNRNENQIYPVHYGIIRDICIFKYRAIKSKNATPTGIKSISEGGVSISYQSSTDTDELPTTLIRKIAKHKLNKVVNRRSKSVMFPEETYDYYEDDSDDEPTIEPVKPVEKQYMYYGRINVQEAGGKWIQYNEITEDMIKTAVAVTKAEASTLNKTSLGLMSATKPMDYLIVAVPKSKNYKVTKDNGIGGKVKWNEDISGSNGIDIIIDGKEYLLYGEVLLCQGQIFIYID